MTQTPAPQRKRRRWPWVLGGTVATLLAAAAVSPILLRPKVPKVEEIAPDAAQAALVARARKLGAADIRTLKAPGGGFVLAGTLEGDQFSVAIPRGWQGNALLYVHGYSTPGTPVKVLDDPLAHGTGANGVLLKAYGEGYAAGHIAYDKAGLGVETASVNTLRLRNLLAGLGATRVLVTGTSMGGNIVVSLLENFPGAFQGGMASCGVTDGWESLFGQLIDMRAAWNVLTAGTDYELPGNHDIRHSALSTEASARVGPYGEAYRLAQILRIAMPVIRLSKAAAADPQGREARILRQVASIGGFEPEVASVAYPLVTIGLGMDDLVATLGGNIHDNRAKVYASPELTAGEAKQLNARIQRIGADQQAIARARKWRQATGSFAVPLVTIHNRIDSLVPYSQSEALGRIAAAAGRQDLLAQYTVPGTRAKLPVGDVEGYTHCGFTPEQSAATWEALRHWTETGQRPAPDAVR